MNKLLAALASASLLFASCSEKFDVAAPHKDITVIYGYLDMADTAHYIRIQKAFLDENQSAVTMAKVADSSFYNNINVKIERYSAGGTHPFIDAISLTRVDLDAEGYPKQPGAFFTSPNYAYKFTGALNPAYIYRLKVTNTATGNIDSADAPVINRELPSASGGFFVQPIDETSTNLSGMSFFSVLPFRNYDIYCRYVAFPGYNYNNETSPVQVAQTVIRFNWLDSNVLTKEKTPHYFDMDAGYTPVKNTDFDINIENQSLYNSIAAGLGAAPDNVYRLLDRCDISVYLSTTEFLNYRTASQAQGTGLTASEITPMYTNVKGKDALGLFTSRASRTGKITITDRTVDSLKASSLLQHTRIAGTAY